MTAGRRLSRFHCSPIVPPCRGGTAAVVSGRDRGFVGIHRVFVGIHRVWGGNPSSPGREPIGYGAGTHRVFVGRHCVWGEDPSSLRGKALRMGRGPIESSWEGIAYGAGTHRVFVGRHCVWGGNPSSLRPESIGYGAGADSRACSIVASASRYLSPSPRDSRARFSHPASSHDRTAGRYLAPGSGRLTRAGTESSKEADHGDDRFGAEV